MTMLERIARAIHAQATDIMEGELPENWDDCGPDHDKAREEWRQLAIAAVKSMREPDFAGPEMLQAMHEAMFVDPWDAVSAAMVGAGFDAALDSILATQPQEQG